MNEKETAELLEMEAMIVDLKTNVAELKKINSGLLDILGTVTGLLEKAEAARPTAHDVAQGLIHDQNQRAYGNSTLTPEEKEIVNSINPIGNDDEDKD